jgi:hypothetical protein
MSGPVSSPYPGNLAMSVAACFFLILSAKSALFAYRLRHDNNGPQSWEANAGFSVFAFLLAMFGFYAIWVLR